MKDYLKLDRLTEKLFGRPQTLKSYKVMRIYFEHLDNEKLKFLIKESHK